MHELPTVEEQFFPLRLEEAGPLIKQSLEAATGMGLSELTPGMWVGTKRLSKWSLIEISARAKSVDRVKPDGAIQQGTSVELRTQRRTDGTAFAIWLSAIILLSALLVPLIPLIWYVIKEQQKHRHAGIVLMHQMWTELTDAVGAPMRATGYRDAPKRVYVPSDERDASSTSASGKRIAAEPARGQRIESDEPNDGQETAEAAELLEQALEQAEEDEKQQAKR